MIFYIKNYNSSFKKYCDIQQQFKISSIYFKKLDNLIISNTYFTIDMLVENLNKDIISNIISFGSITKRLLQIDQILLFKQLCNTRELINDKENNFKRITSILTVLTKKDQQSLLVKLGHASGEFIDEIKKALEKK